jgi:APA family basic amino acid/polyamine antiporter
MPPPWMGWAMGKAGSNGKLNTFDVTNLVVGSIIGADVYVATGVSLRLVGPSSLVVWLIAGIMAVVIALSFAYCVMLLPKVGGPYAYVKEVSTPFAGFMVGWALLLAEWFSMAVFPVAFAQYLTAMVPGIDSTGEVVVKALFVVFIIATNFIGVRAAGRTNDALTIIKLMPLALLIVGGAVFFLAQPTMLATNLSPFVTGDAHAFGSALVLIFWAYAGFELSTLPADNVERPERSIPKAIVYGMLFVIVFYLLTNFIVVGAMDPQQISSASVPLISVASTIFDPLPLLSGIVVLVVGAGAMFSIMGADESGTIGTTQLAFAMAADGLLPHSFAKQSRYGTPYIALVVLCTAAFVVSIFGGLAALINSSVFLLAFVYLATCLSTLRLERKNPGIARKLRWKRAIPIIGATFSLMLILLVDPFEVVVSLLVLAVGVIVYINFSPRNELTEAKALLHSEEAVLKRTLIQRTTFLAHPLYHLDNYLHRKKRTEQAMVIVKQEETKGVIKD